MKTRVILSLSVCCLIFSVVGLVIPEAGIAQNDPVLRSTGHPFDDDDWDYSTDPDVLCPNQLSDFVGIGTAHPEHLLHVEGKAISGINSAAPGQFATVNGGNDNTADGDYATVSGGYNNWAATYGAISGGSNNMIEGDYGVIGGGDNNHVESYEGSTIGGGLSNQALNAGCTVGGGKNNAAGASGDYCTIGGGEYNVASNAYDTVGGGRYNTASGGAATIAGGDGNTASGSASTVGGGRNNTAGHTGATVPGGDSNQALGEYSFAAGEGAQALHDGAFVWEDSTSTSFPSTGDNQFLIYASGGVGINTNSPERPLHVNNVIRLEPRNSIPSSPGEGDLYVDAVDHHIYCYLDGMWKQLD